LYDVPFLVLGNKIDIKPDSVASADEIREYFELPSLSSDTMNKDGDGNMRAKHVSATSNTSMI
jgi:hypothetical protein